jgi:hypothetical protein
VARTCARRRLYSPESERDDRNDEIALKSKAGEITMDNELLYAKIEALEVYVPWPTGSRDDEPDTLALLGTLLRSGARGRSRAPASIALSRRRTRSPVALVRSAHSGTRNWQRISAGT